jgi:hypothetical protein
MVWSGFAKTNHFVSLISQKYIFIFMTLLLLVYFDSSFIELSETFHISLSYWNFFDFCKPFYIY